jgi:hypothetical protein
MYRPMLSWSGKRHAPAALVPREGAPDTYWIGKWEGPRVGVDAMEDTFLALLELEPRIFSPLDRS